jgi:hypothetical protein
MARLLGQYHRLDVDCVTNVSPILTAAIITEQAVLKYFSVAL